MDTVIGPFAQILGKTTIGENCRIGACAIVQRLPRSADEVEIGPFTIVNRSVVERGAVVGPFARLRMENRVGEGAHVGNFVELKKTRLGAGRESQPPGVSGRLAHRRAKPTSARARSPAITTASTKHPTTIGKGAFIGSNSTLVAPLEDRRRRLHRARAR